MDPPHLPRRCDHAPQPGFGHPRLPDDRRLRHRALEGVQGRRWRCRRHNRLARNPRHLRRLTSAAFGAAYGVLFLAIVLGPYRRGDVWAWKALLVAGLTQFVLVLLRIPMLGTQLGVSPAVTQIVLLVVGLLLDVGRFKGPAR
jgi:hypothetical protein